MKKLILITLLLTITACENVPAWKYSMFERPQGNKIYPKEYLKGWKDGCESGAEASANNLYRFKYQFRQDWKMLNNKIYVNGWENAYNHCRKYVLQHNLRKLGRS